MRRECNSLSLIFKGKEEERKEMRAHNTTAMNLRDDKNKMESKKQKYKEVADKWPRFCIFISPFVFFL